MGNLKDCKVECKVCRRIKRAQFSKVSRNFSSDSQPGFYFGPVRIPSCFFMCTLQKKAIEFCLNSVFLPKMMTTFPGKKTLPSSQFFTNNKLSEEPSKTLQLSILKFFTLVLFDLAFLRCSKYFYLALQACCLKQNDHWLLQKKCAKKAGLLSDITDVIVELSVLNNMVALKSSNLIKKVTLIDSYYLLKAFKNGLRQPS